MKNRVPLKNKFILTSVVSLLGLLSYQAAAHLCNDVFDQAKDDLAVKVDIRDGQLRIAKEGAFRVYLLNTMDRDIANINLKVDSDAFTAGVRQSPEWKSFPCLKTAKKGGKKEFFEVSLKRKENLPDGKYQINLVLFNPGDKREFKTLDIEKAADIQAVPLAKSVTVDGNCPEAEWKNSLLCSSFYTYQKDGKYMGTAPSKTQPRFRFLADSQNLYCMLADLSGDSTIYLASDNDSAPVKITIDAAGTKATSSAGDVKDIVVKKGDKNIEVKIPFAEAGIKNPKRFLANLAVSSGNSVSYWRGNDISVGNPVVFAEMSVQ
ncbi:MAG: hypothetical protein WAX69_15160 [Victivallales bacterium]